MIVLSAGSKLMNVKCSVLLSGNLLLLQTERLPFSNNYINTVCFTGVNFRHKHLQDSNPVFGWLLRLLHHPLSHPNIPMQRKRFKKNLWHETCTWIRLHIDARVDRELEPSVKRAFINVMVRYIGTLSLPVLKGRGNSYLLKFVEIFVRSCTNFSPMTCIFVDF